MERILKRLRLAALACCLAGCLGDPLPRVVDGGVPDLAGSPGDGAAGDGAAPCVPITCAGRCAMIPDGCGGTLSCAACAGPVPTCGVAVSKANAGRVADAFTATVTSTSTTACQGQIDGGAKLALSTCNGANVGTGATFGGAGTHTYSVYASGPGGGPVKCTSAAYTVLPNVCSVDAITWHAELAQYDVVGKGRVWNLDGNGANKGPAAGTDLKSYSGLANGACVGQTSCRLDGIAWRSDTAQYIVVYGGSFWQLNASIALVSGPTALTSLPGMAAGPCNGQAGACKIDGLTWRNDLARYYVTYNGKFWVLDGTGAIASGYTAAGDTLNQGGLTAMCTATGSAACPTDDLTWRDDLGQFDVLAAGKVWIVDPALNAATGSGADLTSYSGFAAGPCQ